MRFSAACDLPWLLDENVVKSQQLRHSLGYIVRHHTSKDNIVSSASDEMIIERRAATNIKNTLLRMFFLQQDKNQGN